MFLDPPVADLEHGLERVMTTPRGFAEAELRKVLDPRPSPWTRGLLARDGEAWKVLHTSLRVAHGSVLARSWDVLLAGFHLERAWRVQQLARAGLRGMLAAWEPRIRWESTVLHVRHPPASVAEAWHGGALERRNAHLLDPRRPAERPAPQPRRRWTAAPLPGPSACPAVTGPRLTRRPRSSSPPAPARSGSGCPLWPVPAAS